MTNTKSMMIMLICGLLTCLFYGFQYVSASDGYSCFNKMAAQEQYKQAKTLKQKVQARKAINNWTKFCK